MRYPVICSLLLLLFSAQAVAKDGPTLHTREQTLRARELCRGEDWAVKLRDEAEAGAARWLAMSDEDLWAGSTAGARTRLGERAHKG